MSLARAAAGALLRPKYASTSLLQRRLASTDAHHDEHHDEHHDDHHVEDSTVYPKEDFTGPIWRNTFLVSLAVVAYYKYAPEPSEEAYVTRFLKYYATPREFWERLNLKNLTMATEQMENNLIMADGKRPPVHRYRYPLVFTHGSPTRRPVGMDVDFSDMVIKRK